LVERSTRWAVVIEHAVGDRLASGARFLLGWDGLFRGRVDRVDLALRPDPRLVLAVAHFRGPLAPELEARFTFWAAQARAHAVSLEQLGKRERAHFLARLASARQLREGVEPSRLGEALGGLLPELVGPALERPVRAVVSLSLSRAGLAGPAWDAGDQRLFVPAPILPPVGEPLELELVIEGRVHEAHGVVSSLRAGGGPGDGPGDGPGVTRGYALALERPGPGLREALSALSAPRPGTPPPPALQLPLQRRASPRYRLNAPVRISQVRVERAQSVRLAYPTGQAFAQEWVDNLSLGGAFIRTSQPAPLHAPVVLEIDLPGHVLPPVPATVVRVLPQGMGVQFDPDATLRAALEEALEQLSRRPRRALVAVAASSRRSWAEEALVEHGFEVQVVADAEAALRVLLEDAPWLDVLIVDADLKRGDGRPLVRAIREEGGEQELTIAVLTASGSGHAPSPAGPDVDLIVEHGVAGLLFAARLEQILTQRAEGAPRTLEVLQDPSSGGPVPLSLHYEDPQRLRAEAQVLRLGGAFVPTGRSFELGEEVRLSLLLPEGMSASGTASVVSCEPTGVAIQFTLDAEGEGALHAALGAAPPPAPPAPPFAYTSLFEEEPSRIHGPTVGPFVLQSLLGRGGVAEVHFARVMSGPLSGRHVALKRLLPHIAKDPRFVELFAGEADVTRMLEHPNLVKTLAVGLHDELPWMAMEVIDGSDLLQLLTRARHRQTHFPVGFAVGVVGALLSALEYAHDACGLSGEPLNLVHCDVSPANVFLTRAGEVKLGDFGVARAGGVALEVAGKAHYLSPEALDGTLAPAVDLWAAAVLLYELLTLSRPFDGPDPDAVLRAVRKRHFTPARKLRPELPAALDRVLTQALDPKPHRRPTTAAGFRESLGPWLGEGEAHRRELTSHARRLLEDAA